MRLLLTAALRPELRLILNALEEQQAHEDGVTLGRLRGFEVGVAPLGVGVVSAAHALGRILGRYQPAQILMVGSAGAMPDSGLGRGDLVVASTETFSELGVLQEAGIGSVEGLSFPGLFKTLPLDPEMVRRLSQCSAGLAPVLIAPCLTVAGVSANPRQARARALRFGVLSESMEGYALALAAKTAGIPAAEIRGISNEAGRRDKAHWDLECAQFNAQKAALAYVEELPR